MSGPPVHHSGILELEESDLLAGTEFEVPEPDTWVIEHVSAWIIVPAGELFRPLEVWTAAPAIPSGTSRPHHYLIPLPLAGSDRWYGVSQPTRLYAMAGSEVRVQFQRNKASGPASVRFTLSGRLLGPGV